MNNSELLSIEFVKDVCVQNTQHRLLLEANKGSDPKIYHYRVDLEPRFEKFSINNMFVSSCKDPRLVDRSVKRKSKYHLVRILFPLVDNINWRAYEVANASVSELFDFMSFESVGNKNGIQYFNGSCSKENVGSIVNSWQSFMPEICYTESPDPMIEIAKSNDLFFVDIYPQPPIHWKTTDCYDLTTSPLIKLASLFAKITPPALGFCQIMFKHVKNDWAGNMKQLLEGESILGRRSPFGRSTKEQIKGFASKPLFAVRVRFGGNCPEPWFQPAIKMFVSNYKCCGKAFLFRTSDEFRKVLSQKQISTTLIERSTVTSGFLATSSEITTFVHLPDRNIINHNNIVSDYIKGFPVPEKLRSKGLPLGIAAYKGESPVVHIPISAGNKSTYMIGSTTYGKSNSMISQMLYLISQGFGVLFIDFHGQTAQELLDHIQEPFIERCINLDISDENYALCMNPCDIDNEEDWGKLTGDYLESLKGIFLSGWGPRMEHILGKVIYGLIVTKRNLSYIPVILSETPEGEMIRAEIINKAKNLEVQRFFKCEFQTYNKSAFLPIINKFSNFFLDERVRRLYSVRENRIYPKKIMDESMCVIADLSIGKIDPGTASFTAGMLISQFQKAAFKRSKIPPEDRQPFYIFIDEFQRLSNFAVIESIINECRTCGLFITISHQETGQLPDDTLLALRSVANTMVFNINIDDARRMTKQFDDKVSISDIIGLGVGEVYARVCNNVVKFKTFPPLERRQSNASKIIQQSRDKYYIPVADFDKESNSIKGKRQYELF